MLFLYAGGSRGMRRKHSSALKAQVALEAPPARFFDERVRDNWPGRVWNWNPSCRVEAERCRPDELGRPVQMVHYIQNL